MTDDALYDKEYARLYEQFPVPELSKTDIPAARAGITRYFQEVARRHGAVRHAAAVVVKEAVARGEPDRAPVPVRIYRPNDHERGRALIYLHGGGFTVGDLDIEDDRCRRLACGARCIVVSVGYRLAPEHPFPLGLEDGYTALEWLAQHAGDLAIDPDRIGVSGCSAGGALAAGLAALALDRGGPPIAMQLLLYAVLDHAVGGHGPDEETRGDVRRMWKRYLGAERPIPPPYAAPARRADLSGLPPAHIVTAELDIFRDQAVAYAQMLWNHGVRAGLQVWPGVPHAFDQVVPQAAISQRAVADQTHAIIRLLG